jgi:bifunctional DNA primase/polymerase-like protein
VSRSPHKNKKTAPRTFASPLEGALFMAAKGFRVFPLQPKTKNPFESEVAPSKYRTLCGGYHIATKDEKRIRGWQKACPELNFGVYAGDGVIADVDMKNGRDGFAAYKRDFGDEPDTFRVNTPSGGAHLYFDDEPRGQRPLIDCYVDIRSRHGYVVCPGSVVNGGTYTVARDVPLLPLPVNVKEALAKKPERQARSKEWLCDPDNETAIAHAIGWLKGLEETPEGKRNNEAYKIAARLKDLGLTAETSLALMCEHLKIGLDDNEMSAACHNAHRYGQSPPGYLSVEACFGDIINDPWLKEFQKDTEKERKRREPPVLSYAKPFESAAEFIRRTCTRAGGRALHWLDDEFLVYTGTHYEAASDKRIKGSLWRFLQRAKRIEAKSEEVDGKRTKTLVEVPFHPKTTHVDNAQVLRASASPDRVPRHRQRP